MLFLIIWNTYKIGWIGSLRFGAKTAEWLYENVMITNTKIVYAEQQALKPQMGVLSGWAAVQSTLFSSFPLLQEGRNLLVVIISISLAGFCCSICSTLHDVAETAALHLLVYILHLRFFGHNSSSRSGGWALSLFLPDKLVGDFVVGFQRIRSSLIGVFFWRRSVQNCKVGLIETGMPNTLQDYEPDPMLQSWEGAIFLPQQSNNVCHFSCTHASFFGCAWALISACIVA